jgi:hypothetical protein
MYVYGKMRPVETIPGIGGRRIKENERGDEFSMMYLVYWKSFCNATKYPKHNNKKKKIERKKSCQVL